MKSYGSRVNKGVGKRCHQQFELVAQAPDDQPAAAGTAAAWRDRPPEPDESFHLVTNVASDSFEP